LFASPWWVLTLAVIGAIALVAVILGLFSSLGEDPDDATATELCPVHSFDFLLAVAGTTNTPLQEGGSARLHNNGDEIFPALYAAMEGAKRSINFMVYIWEPGEVSTRLFDIMVERARAGVQVRVMGDGLGARKAPKERIEELCAAGGKWCWFHPPRFGQLTYFHKRNHRRAIIVDGEVGFTGGAAVADKWLGSAQDPEHWRDAMVELRGPIASNLQPAFVQLWSHITGELLVGPAFYPVEHENLGIHTTELDDVLQHVDVLSSPSTDDYPLRRVFQLSFRCARESIYITNPYFVPDRISRNILKERARAGVDVRALVPNENNDVKLIRWASHSYYEDLLEAGVRLYEYQPTMIHQKHLVIDGEWCVVGSANMDVRSKELNQECVLGILDKEFGKTVQDTFFRDLERAHEVTLAEWRRRPWTHTLKDRFFRLFEQQF
jgi:cardiolipin synthase